MQDKINRIKELVQLLNTYRDEYYNLARPSVSDSEYDKVFDELQQLENETEFIICNSPTQTVGFEVKSKLEKVKHNHPMLSLDKTKSIDDILSFLNGKEGIAMLKMDGLTGSSLYENKVLTGFESRGNGEIGEQLIHNARTIQNLPKQIKIDNLIVDGEVIIDYDTFEEINNKLSEDEKYKNPRNLASGSIRQLDSKIASERKMRFVAWKVISGIDDNSFFKRLQQLYSLGFEVVPHCRLKKDIAREELEIIINELKSYAEKEKLPIDGIVCGYDDIEYGASLGQTGHHVRSQIAFKFADEVEETVLRNVEWNTTRTGQINPTAIFDTVVIDNTDVSRASLHNLSVINELKINIGSRILVSKRNLIIPHIEENLDKNNGILDIPEYCPACGHKTYIENTGTANFLFCKNDICSAQIHDKFVNFVKRDSMNIDGLATSTLEKFIELGFIKIFGDIYRLNEYESEIVKLEGMGEKSYKKLIDNINKSRNVKLENFITSLGIDGVGLSTAKLIAKKFKTIESFINAKNAELLNIDGIGDITAQSICDYRLRHLDIILDLMKELNFVQDEPKEVNNNLKDLNDLTFVITGSVNTFKNRDEFKELVESLNGKVSGSVSNKTNYLVNNDKTSTTGKNKKAMELGIEIISEDDFNSMIGRII